MWRAASVGHVVGVARAIAFVPGQELARTSQRDVLQAQHVVSRQRPIDRRILVIWVHEVEQVWWKDRQGPLEGLRRHTRNAHGFAADLASASRRKIAIEVHEAS